MRIVITGWPGTGKTTLASEMGGGRSTDEVMGLGWSESSLAVSQWFDEPGPWIVEGVTVPRALRKWMTNNPGKAPPIDKIIMLHGAYHELSKGQTSMGKGIDTVMRQISTWLASVPTEHRRNDKKEQFS